MRSLLTIAVLIGNGFSMAAQAPVLLHTGQILTLKGTLVLRTVGRLQFAALKTAGIYAPASPDRKGSVALTCRTHELGLSGFHNYRLLYQHRGQRVVVRGRVFIDSVSPYYLNGMSLATGSIRTEAGLQLQGQPYAPSPIAVDVGQYTATVALAANPTQPWQYTAHGAADNERRFLSCSSNGAGDVVNCTCAKEYSALQANSTSAGVPTRILQDSHVAQFDVGVQARRMQLSVICTR